MAKPKLALIPAAQGSKFYSVLPSSGVGDFTFSRSGSATRINSQGLIETVGNGVSRLNYPMIDGVVSGCPHHILEPSRSNLATYSEDFSQGWNKNNSTVTTNQTTSPSGDLTADKFISDDTNQPRVERAFAVPSSDTTYTFSVFVKKINTRYIALSRFSGGEGAIFDLDTKSVVSSSAENASIKEMSNGWFRISITQTVLSTDSFNIWKINGTNGYSIGTGIVGDETFIWGAMLEQGSYATSYIPTNGSAVTRSAETANGSGDASTFNNSEGVLMAEISSLTNNNPLFNSLSIASGTTNVLSIGFSDSLNELYVFKTNGSSSWFKEVLVNDITNFNKIALSYESNDNQFWINGFKIETNNSIGIHPSAMSDMDFNAAVGNEFMYSNTKQLQYFDSALTDSELETLTSWTSFSDMAEGQLYTIE